ncbi:PREDICTED: serine/threonine-protein kinase/endoribonuclease IRE1a isoform X1 [Nicotiana attenuata]|uniref:non-specific serine/threonine protein kinase n=2 Tax=Nicotiana attenuata TaxID=49451 RepID=A0A314L2U8_NICAT|nr:PREDICTED: serine/threonine-protein kinase/endoribonuclease IRE1a isoform X1 [Nicotiana attenuata]OIT35822.1 serinethreonine-protein kinase/endoribonuclease ire1a [Nicotiana attenuata]
MKRHWVILVCILLLVFGFTGLASELLSLPSSPIEGISDEVTLAPARRNLLSELRKPETALVAELDGTVHLREVKTEKTLWSFRSGPSIYSSYQAPINYNDNREASSDIGSGYFIDCRGDDWELYAHNRLGKLKLMKNIDEYISSTPQIAEDGGIVLGSKRTTAFLVDAKTGRLIYTYKMPDSPATNNNDITLHHNGTIDEESLPTYTLYITRTDYALTSFIPNSDQVLWNMTVAEIGAASLCKDIEDPFSGDILDSDRSEPDVHFDMPLPCQSRALIHRRRSQQEKMLPGAHRPELPSSETNVDNADTSHLEYAIKRTMFGILVVFILLIIKKKNSEDVKTQLKEGITKSSERLSTPVRNILATLVEALTRNCDSVAEVKLVRQPDNSHSPNVPSKRKKSRKSGKNGSNGEKSDKGPSSDGGLQYSDVDADNKLLLNLIQPSIYGKGGRTIGKLFVSSTEIAKGSNGTVVLEGIYDGRAVAVKRLVRAHHDIAFKEIKNLIASDRHPNIVRWYGVEQDQDFVYLALERCICSLSDLIQIYADTTVNARLNQNLDAESTKRRIHLDYLKGIMLDTELRKENGFPSPLLLKLMRDVVSGLVHLHDLGIIHRDLKPPNVLITKERFLGAKLSDMGISKRLIGDMSSLGHHATGYGSSGWQAPEQLLHGRQTRAVDIFSLGCVLFFCVTDGSHPFGSPLERDINITKNKIDLFLVEHIPEAVDLFSHLLDPNAELRPKAVDVLAHPFFWTSEMRLSFLRDSSDRVELEDRETSSDLLKALEGTAPVALGGKWDEKMEPPFINNIGRYRRYKFDSVRDLLRVMRNKLNHYRELPTEIQEILGTVPEGFDGYFRSRFPKLLIEVYKVMSDYCRNEDCFQKYFTSSVL